MNGAEGAGGVVGGPVTNEAVRSPRAKWRIACINWSHKDAPHAAAYYINGDRLYDHYFQTWAEAVSWVDKITRKP